MSLAVKSNRKGLNLTVQTIYEYPTLRGMAAIASRIKASNVDLDRIVEPFELMCNVENIEHLLAEVGTKCNLDSQFIEDVLPCLPSQETFIESNTKAPGSSTVQHVMTISPDTDLDHLCQAWETTVASLPILRTRIVLLDSGQAVQVVSSMVGPVHKAHTELSQYLEREAQMNMTYGTSLSRASIAPDSAGKWYFIWTCNHSIYDGWSQPLIMERLIRAYDEAEEVTHAGQENDAFRKLIRHIRDQDVEKAASYWQKQFHELHNGKLCDKLSAASSKACQIDTSLVFTANADGLQSQIIPGVTAATLIHAAWAIIIGHWQQCSNVVLRTAVSGRSAPLAGLSSLAAPTIAHVPLRVRLDIGNSEYQLGQFVAALQDQIQGMMPYEQTGMRRIRQMSAEASDACDAAIPFVVHPKQYSADSYAELPLRHLSTTLVAMRPAPISLECFISGPDSVDVFLNIDSHSVSIGAAEGLVPKFQFVLERLCSPEPSRTLKDLWNEIDSVALNTSIAVKKLTATGRVTFSVDGQAVIRGSVETAHGEILRHSRG